MQRTEGQRETAVKKKKKKGKKDTLLEQSV